MCHVQLESMPNVQLLSKIGNSDYVVTVHSDVEMTIVSVSHPVIGVAFGADCDL